jgi:hypothetical protein
MDMTYFLRFYTAFAEDQSPSQPVGEAEALTAQRKPSIDAFSIVHREDKLAQDAGARSH